MNSDLPTPASALRARLALDLRSLALLRAGLAAFLLCDALTRAAGAGLLYADSGLLPRDLAINLGGGIVSLHLANGSVVFAGLLSFVQALVAAALLVGWRTRLAGALLWLLCVSAFARHPAAVTAADTLALSLLSLGLFLPWQSRWSVDAARIAQRPQASHLSWAGLVLLAQAVALPLLLGLHGGSDALATLLASPQAHAPGRWLADFPSILALLWPAIAIAAALIFLLALMPVVQPQARRVALAIYALLIVLATLSVWLGGLTWLALLSAALLVDSALWDRLAGPSPVALRLYHDREDHGAQRRATLLREWLCLPNTRVQPAQDSARVARLFGQGTRLVVIDGDEQAYLDADAVAVLLRRSPLLRALPGAHKLSGLLLARMAHRDAPVPVADPRASVVAAPRHTALVLVLGALLAVVQLAAAGGLPASAATPARWLLSPLALGTSWIERLPSLSSTRSWIAVIGEHRDGREVDALSDALDSPSFEPRAFALLGGERGRRYAQVLTEDGAQIARTGLARHLCARHAPSLLRVRVVQLVQPPDANEAEQRVLLRHECGESP